MRKKVFNNFSTILFNIQQRPMTLFKQIINPITGQNEWETHPEIEYDYHQEVANTGFGDMLHDEERNKKYYAALRKTINRIHNDGRKVHVLDIGTGTGILSMMALKAGADKITACEAFVPMANCAERILKANGFGNKINLIKKRSTDIQIGIEMDEKANLLVTEILDTELIGEGAISIYNHAHAFLLTDDVVCIPAKANCYVQVVQSALASQWNTMKVLPNLDGDILLHPLPNILKCNGEVGLHDIQLSQLPTDLFHAITRPVKIFEFDFNSVEPIPTQRRQVITAKAIKPGSTDLVFYWWEIEMDLDKESILSCAPHWEHPDFKKLANEKNNTKPLSNIIPWRDHWMQAIYYISKPLQISSLNDEFTLICYHDEYSLWFKAEKTPPTTKEPETKLKRPVCFCSFHTSYSRNRMGQLNQAKRNKKYLQYLEEVITKDSSVLVISDGSLVGLATAKLGAANVTVLEPFRLSRSFMMDLAKHNELNNVRFIETLDCLDDNELNRITHIFAEPYFLTSILPWDNFYFGTLLSKIKDKLAPHVKISPHSAKIYGVSVEFLDLHKIRAPVNNCEGFDLTLFDEIVEKSSDVSQTKVEAQPLWEYPCRALAHPQEFLNVVFNDYQDKEFSGKIKMEHSGTCNGVALWVDWHIDDTQHRNSIVSTGTTKPVELGAFIEWDMFVRQGVHLMRKPQEVTQNHSHLSWALNFKPKSGQFQFQFNFND